MSIDGKVNSKVENLFEKVTFSNTDLFADDVFSNKANGNDGNNNNNYDPFGAPTTTKPGKSFNSPDDFGFEADFANFDSFNDSKPNGTGKTADAWGTSLDKSNNNVGNGKISKRKQEEINKEVPKFKTDYSENFDKDLEQVLKRSLFDQ